MRRESLDVYGFMPAFVDLIEFRIPGVLECRGALLLRARAMALDDTLARNEARVVLAHAVIIVGMAPHRVAGVLYGTA